MLFFILNIFYFFILPENATIIAEAALIITAYCK